MLLSNYGRDKKKGKNLGKKVRKKYRVLGRTTPCVKPKTSKQYIALKSEEQKGIFCSSLAMDFHPFSRVFHVHYICSLLSLFCHCFLSMFYFSQKKKSLNFYCSCIL